MCVCVCVCVCVLLTGGVFADDGGGTPVQDEHPASEDEQEKPDSHQSEVSSQVWSSGGAPVCGQLYSSFLC